MLLSYLRSPPSHGLLQGWELSAGLTGDCRLQTGGRSERARQAREHRELLPDSAPLSDAGAGAGDWSVMAPACPACDHCRPPRPLAPSGPGLQARPVLQWSTDAAVSARSAQAGQEDPARRSLTRGQRQKIQRSREKMVKFLPVPGLCPTHSISACPGLSQCKVQQQSIHVELRRNIKFLSLS